MRKTIFINLFAACLCMGILAGYKTGVSAKESRNNFYDVVQTTDIATPGDLGLYADGIFSPGKLGTMRSINQNKVTGETQRKESIVFSPGKFGEEEPKNGTVRTEQKGNGTWLSPGQFGEMRG